MQEKLRTAAPILFIVFGLALASLAIFLFAHLTDELLENELNAFDTSLMALVSIFQTPFMDAFMNTVTFLGDISVLAGLAVVLLFYFFFRKKDKVQGGVFLLLAAGSGVLIWLLKRVFERDRPNTEASAAVDTFSFPSGHTLGAFVFYGFLIYLIVRSRQNIWIKGVMTALLTALIFLIGGSRVYLGVHFPTDVAAGFFTGAAWLLFCLLALEWLKQGTTKEKQSGKALMEFLSDGWNRLAKRRKQ